MSTDGTMSHSVTEKGAKQRKKPLPTFFVSVKLWLHSDMRIWAASSWSQSTLKADSHIACRAHAVLLRV
jgi:hypothetical protein